MEICSRYNIWLYKNNGLITRYPSESRNNNIVADLNISMNCELEWDLWLWFIQWFTDLYFRSSKSRILNFWVNENCDFTDSCYGAKNCYLSFWLGWWIEDSLYSFFVAQNCSSILNTMSATYNCSNIYFCKSVKNSFNIFYSTNIINSQDIRFSSNLISCSECMFCDNLINQSYCINNTQYGKNEYYDLQSTYLQQKEKFDQRHISTLEKLKNINVLHSTWWWIANSENIENGYIVTDTKKARNVVLLEWWEKWSVDMYDGIDIWIDSNNFYGLCQVWTNSNDLYCGVFIGMSSYCYYCMNLDTCSFCLGCIGLKNKSYCILNKQYTKEERYEKVDEIFSQMEKDGTLWDFFPATMNPFYFNDTAAYLIDPTFTKEEVTSRWFLRRDDPIKVDIPEWAKVVKTSELDKYEGYRDTNLPSSASGRVHPPYQEGQNRVASGWHSNDNSPSPSEWSGAEWTVGRGSGWGEKSRTIDPEILNYIIQDEQGNVYRIVKMEYDFLMKYGLPLPRKHRLDRMKENFRIS